MNALYFLYIHSGFLERPIRSITIGSIVHSTTTNKMMSLVMARKRKDGHNPMTASHDKGKVRIIERSVDPVQEFTNKFPRLRSSLPNTRAFSNIRRGSVKIFSVFRSGKGMQ
jgi:hypothetical protein